MSCPPAPPTTEWVLIPCADPPTYVSAIRTGAVASYDYSTKNVTTQDLNLNETFSMTNIVVPVDIGDLLELFVVEDDAPWHTFSDSSLNDISGLMMDLCDGKIRQMLVESFEGRRPIPSTGLSGLDKVHWDHPDLFDKNDNTQIYTLCGLLNGLNKCISDFIVECKDSIQIDTVKALFKMQTSSNTAVKAYITKQMSSSPEPDGARELVELIVDRVNLLRCDMSYVTVTSLSNELVIDGIHTETDRKIKLMQDLYLADAITLSDGGGVDNWLIDQIIAADGFAVSTDFIIKGGITMNIKLLNRPDRATEASIVKAIDVTCIKNGLAYSEIRYVDGEAQIRFPVAFVLDRSRSLPV